MGVARHHLAGALCFPPRESNTMLKIIPVIFVTSIVTWVVVYCYYFAPRARVKRLWDEAFKLAYELGEVRKKIPSEARPFEVSYNKAITKRHALINAILDYYFDPDEDGEYINQNRAENKPQL